MEKGFYTEVETEKFLKDFVPIAKHKLCKTSILHLLFYEESAENLIFDF